MTFFADLHVHSRFSRATSRECVLERFAVFAAAKGLSVVGTGDFTHPAWFSELKEKLAPAEPGLFKLRPELEKEVEKGIKPSCRGRVRFMLSMEISTIYKKGEKTRKIHHLILAPDFASASRFRDKLGKLGNIESDGRPILGLDSRDLLEIALESGEGVFLIPAHIWTPWFSMLGSKSGFDSVEECYADLAPHIFALETGLSSDPPMNFRLSALDRYRLVSNSDAHSPEKLAREACVFDTELNYFEMKKALETGAGYLGTVEFFPEEGKYHFDGHRKCGVRLSPKETRELGGLCPVCKRPVTVGVMHRVEELADREEGQAPDGAAPFRSFIPLKEVIAEIMDCGPASKAVGRFYERLVSLIGPELFILEKADLEEVKKAGSELLAEAVKRMREGRVIREAGYDGEYGKIKLFEKEELDSGRGKSEFLFTLPEEEKEKRADDENGRLQDTRSSAPSLFEGTVLREPAAAPTPENAPSKDFILAGLDENQRAAASCTEGPLLIVAGPGTGKTRTLTHRIAYLIKERGAAPESCLALTFTNRAAGEMRERLHALVGEGLASRIPVLTFHSLGLLILKECWKEADLPRDFRVAGEEERAEILGGLVGGRLKNPAALLSRISRLKRGMEKKADKKLRGRAEAYSEKMRELGLVDFDDLLMLPLELFQSRPELARGYQERFKYVSVDEYQDIDEFQYRLLRFLVPPDGNLCCIGDPDQAIYSFRGAEVGFFLRFKEDFPSAKVVRLERNYRTSRPILAAASQMIAGESLAGTRHLIPSFDSAFKVSIHESQNETHEAMFVARTIIQMMGGHGFFSLDKGEVESSSSLSNLSFSDFAVLYRTEEQGEVLAEVLSREGIPFQRRTHRRLGGDPWGGLLLWLMARSGPEMSPAAALQSSAEQILLAFEQGRFRELPLELFFEDPEMFSGLEPEELENKVRLETDSLLERFFPLAEKAAAISEFLSLAALSEEVDTLETRAERVSLLTLHASKGLEFPVVFITGCEDGLLPLRWGGEDEPALAEERRLFFVGMTRAKHRLILSRAKTRRWRGKVHKFPPSPFLRDIEEALLKRHKVPTGKGKPRPAAEQLKLF